MLFCLGSLTAELEALTVKVGEITPRLDEVTKQKNALLEEGEVRRAELTEANKRCQEAERTIVEVVCINSIGL